MSKKFLVVILLGMGVSFSLLAQENPAILAAMRRADPAIQKVAVLARVAGSGNVNLSMVLGTANSELVPDPVGTFPWYPSDTLSLISEDRSANAGIRILKSFRHNSDGCCAVRVLRATASEFVLSRVGEKLQISPNLQLSIDSKTGVVTTAEYMPFSIQGVRMDSGVPTFVASDESQFLAIRASTAAPFLQLLSGQTIAPPRTATAVPASLFGARSPSLPQSTYLEFAAARPARVADGYRKEDTEIKEAIGPVQVVGSRTWFGKTFYDGEGETGVGAFGYFDSGEGKYHLFSSPEIRDWSVSAILIEGQTAWLGLASHGEGAESSGGLLQVDLQTTKVKKFDVKGEVNEMIRYQALLFLATSEGVSIIFPDGSMQHAFVDIASDRSHRLSFTTP